MDAPCARPRQRAERPRHRDAPAPLDALGTEIGFTPPSLRGLDSVEAIRSLRDGRPKVFLGGAGIFVRAAQGSEVPEQALRRSRLAARLSGTADGSFSGRVTRQGETPGRRVPARRPSDAARVDGRVPPEAPALVPLGSVADLSNTPTPKGDRGPMGARRGPMRRTRTSA